MTSWLCTECGYENSLSEKCGCCGEAAPKQFKTDTEVFLLQKRAEEIRRERIIQEKRQAGIRRAVIRLKKRKMMRFLDRIHKSLTAAAFAALTAVAAWIGLNVLAPDTDITLLMNHYLRLPVCNIMEVNFTDNIKNLDSNVISAVSDIVFWVENTFHIVLSDIL